MIQITCLNVSPCLHILVILCSSKCLTSGQHFWLMEPEDVLKFSSTTSSSPFPSEVNMFYLFAQSEVPPRAAAGEARWEKERRREKAPGRNREGRTTGSLEVTGMLLSLSGQRDVVESFRAEGCCRVFQGRGMLSSLSGQRDVVESFRAEGWCRVFQGRGMMWSLSGQRDVVEPFRAEGCCGAFQGRGMLLSLSGQRDVVEPFRAEGCCWAFQGRGMLLSLSGQRDVVFQGRGMLLSRGRGMLLSQGRGMLSLSGQRDVVESGQRDVVESFRAEGCCCCCRLFNSFWAIHEITWNSELQSLYHFCFWVFFCFVLFLFLGFFFVLHLTSLVLSKVRIALPPLWLEGMSQ